MADKNPFGSLGLGMMGGERGYVYQGGPLTDALKGLKTGATMYLADKSGLTGFLNNLGVSQDTNTGAFKYKPNAPAGAVPPGASAATPGAPAASVAPPSAGGAPVINAAPAAIGQTALGTPGSPAAPAAPVSIDQQVNDTWGPSSFKLRDESKDELPTQFAMGPVAPPMGQIPQAQIPQSSGLGKALLSFLG